MKSLEGYEKDALDVFFKPHIQNGSLWIHKTFTGGFGKSGVPDYVGCARHTAGKLFAIEVKREGKAPTALQWKRMEEIEAAGGKAFWGTAAKVIPEFKVWIA